MLVNAERAVGAVGRPEAVDGVGEVFGLLQELAERARKAAQ